jgi:hypothetical protein
MDINADLGSQLPGQGGDQLLANSPSRLASIADPVIPDAEQYVLPPVPQRYLYPP